jgi:L-ascorbate metabolism protein UlaG (beta-lactamase superfamily)
LKELGFRHVVRVENAVEWEGCKIIRTPGRHGTGEIGEKMGPVSGFILIVESDMRLYIAGDTIYCQEVAQTLETYAPDIVVVNAGAAQFATGSPITMTAQDVISVCRQSEASQIVAVHMDAINHCLETRAQLNEIARTSGYGERIRIPADGEVLIF